VVFMPASLVMTAHDPAGWQAEPLLEEIGMLRAAGMTGMTVTLPGETRRELLDGLERFGAEVLSELAP
jgi:hypothetical protein